MDIFNSISKKVMVGYLGIVIVLLIIAVMLYRESGMVNTRKQVFVEQTLPTLRTIEAIERSLNQAQITAFGLYGTTIELAEFDREWGSNAQEVEANIAKLRTYALVNEKELSTLNDDAVSAITALRGIMAKDGVDWDAARDALKAIQVSMQALSAAVKNVNAAASRQAEQASDDISHQIVYMRLLIVISVCIICAITALAFYLAQRTIVLPVTSLSSQLDRISEQQDLSRDVAVSSRDEVAVAARSVNNLLTALREGYTQIQQSAGLLVDSVSQLNHSAQVSESQVKTFNKHVDAMLHTIDELETSIETSATRSAQASYIALEGAEQVKTGASSVSQTSRSIAELAGDVEKSADMLLSLKNAGAQVSSVVKTIADIAEQTNLLALNAAIEAARAGESGRGFAVVADEVRTLASRTHDSTHEINQILETIVNSISSTVTSMESNKTKATEAVELAKKTVDSLDVLQQTVLKLSHENQELASLGQANKTNAGAMRASVNEINSASTQVTESSRETRGASDNLSAIAVDLRSVAGRFTLT